MNLQSQGMIYFIDVDFFARKAIYKSYQNMEPFKVIDLSQYNYKFTGTPRKVKKNPLQQSNSELVSITVAKIVDTSPEGQKNGLYQVVLDISKPEKVFRFMRLTDNSNDYTKMNRGLLQNESSTKITLYSHLMDDSDSQNDSKQDNLLQPLNLYITLDSPKFEINHEILQLEEESNLRLYNLNLRGLNKVQVKQYLRADISYPIKIQFGEEIKTPITKQGTYEIGNNVSGILMNSTVYCAEPNSNFNLNRHGIDGVTCDGTVSARLTRHVELKYKVYASRLAFDADAIEQEDILGKIISKRVFPQTRGQFVLVLAKKFTVLRLRGISTVVFQINLLDNLGKEISIKKCDRILNVEKFIDSTLQGYFKVTSLCKGDNNQYKSLVFVIEEEVLKNLPEYQPEIRGKFSLPEITRVGLWYSFKSDFFDRTLSSAKSYWFHRSVFFLIDSLEINEINRVFLNLYTVSKSQIQPKPSQIYTEENVNLNLQWSSLRFKEFLEQSPEAFFVQPLESPWPDQEDADLKFRMVVASISRYKVTFAVYEFSQEKNQRQLVSNVVCSNKVVDLGNIKLEKIWNISFARINSRLHMYIIDEIFLNEYVLSAEIDQAELPQGLYFRLADTYKHASICSPRSSQHIIRYKESLLLSCSLKENQGLTDLMLVYQKNGVNVDEKQSINPVQILEASPINLVRSFFLGIYSDPKTQSDLMVMSSPDSFIAIYQLNSVNSLNLEF